MMLRSRSLPLLLLVLLAPRGAAAQKLDKDDKKFLDDVRPILLPDEEKTFKKLKDKADRAEFQKIFWARRDPNLDTEDNEYRHEYETARAEADAAYKVAGRPGSLNDCGRLFIVLGKPDEVKKEGTPESPSLRAPETWTYRDRPGFTFAGGQALMSLDGECRLPEGNMGEQLDRIVANRIPQPNIDYRLVKDGKLTKLVDLLPKPSPARALLKEPRQDFALQSQAMFLKVQDGGTALLGVVRGDASTFPTEERGGRKVARVVVAGSAVGEDGKEAASVERKTVAEVHPDGSFAAAIRLSLRPGKYTLKAAALDEKGGKGSVATSAIEVPDYGKGELGMASLMVLRDVVDLPGGEADPDAAFAPFQLGAAQLVPFGTTALTKADAPTFFYQVYDLKVDEFTGKASATASLGIFRAQVDVALGVGEAGTPTAATRYKLGAPRAQAQPQILETPIAGSAVGPVPLTDYEPGVYLVQLKVSDKVAKKDKIQEVAIEVKP
jgi:GWxTD domain-containing protein